MQQIKFYRVTSLPTAELNQPCEVGSLYFVHDDANNFNDLYVCTGEYTFESYSGHLYWSDGSDGGSGGGDSWVDGDTGESIDPSLYLPLTGGTMTGDIDMSNSKILFNDGKSGSIYGDPDLLETLVINTGNTKIQIGQDLTVNNQIKATAFYETSDVRKKDIKSELSLDKCYDLIDKCQTVIYSLKNQTKEQVGMIAQEIEEFFPEVVATDEEGFKSLAYDRLVVICFKVLKDVIKRLENIENHDLF